MGTFLLEVSGLGMDSFSFQEKIENKENESVRGERNWI
jgi:hypothetical protein